MNKALILGAAGQDSSYLSEFLLDKGYEVVGVKRRSTSSSMWRLANCIGRPNFSLIDGDVTDLSFLLRTLNAKHFTEVYNLAAQSQVGVSFDSPISTWEVTAQGAMNVLEAVRMSTSRPKVYQASSSEMYGDSYSSTYPCCGWNMMHQAGESIIHRKWQDENTKFNPQSPYAIAKLAAHHSVGVYRKAYNMFAVGGILFNHESPRRGSSFVTRKITRWAESYQKGNKQRLKLGNLDAVRDWGYAGDYVEAMWLMLQQTTPKDYVISTNTTHTVKDFLLKVGDVCSLDVMSLVDINEDLMRPCEVPYLRGDNSLAKKELGWEPKIDFNRLVEFMVLKENGLD